MRHLALVGMLGGLSACGATTPSSSGSSGDAHTAPSASVAALSSPIEPATSAAPSASPSAVASSGPATPPPLTPDPSAITITTIKVPLALNVDGDPSEWGALDVLLTQTDKPQRRGPSHVAVALDEKALHLAGSVSGAAKSGFTIALRFGAPDLPSIGFPQRSGGVMSIGDCTEEVPGLSLPIDECKKVQAAYDAYVAADAARYTRVLFVDEKGITSTGAAISKLLATAKFKSKPTADGFTFEADLPVGALPRTQSPAIEGVDLAARVGTGAPPNDAFYGASFTSPVSFDPHRAAREWALQFGRVGGLGMTVVSWQPGDFGKIEVIDRGASGLTLEATERALYTKLGGDAKLEFGLVHVAAPTVVVIQDGHVGSTCSFSKGPKSAVKKRMRETDGWLMVSAFDYFRGDSGFGRDAGFDTCFVLADGNAVTGVWSGGGMMQVWENVTPTISADLETLSLAGQAYDFSTGVQTMKYTSQSWRLDKAEGVYTEQP